MQKLHAGPRLHGGQRVTPLALTPDGARPGVVRQAALGTRPVGAADVLDSHELASVLRADREAFVLECRYDVDEGLTASQNETETTARLQIVYDKDGTAHHTGTPYTRPSPHGCPYPLVPAAPPPATPTPDAWDLHIRARSQRCARARRHGVRGEWSPDAHLPDEGAQIGGALEPTRNNVAEGVGIGPRQTLKP